MKTPEEWAAHVHRIRFDAGHGCPFYPCEHVLAETAAEFRAAIAEELGACLAAVAALKTPTKDQWPSIDMSMWNSALERALAAIQSRQPSESAT